MTEKKLDNLFGVIGDPHIISREYVTTKWLRKKVAKLNELDLDFVLVCGDLAHGGCIDEFLLAKEILDELNTKYYCCHGNHDYGFDGELNLNAFHGVFGTPQFVVQVCHYNLLVLQLIKWNETPLEINGELPSIALIHTTSKTSQNLLFPHFDNPELESFLKDHNVKTVFQGHVHQEQKVVHHNGIQHINCSTGLGIGYLGSSVLYVPVTGTIEDAFSELVFMKEVKENGEN